MSSRAERSGPDLNQGIASDELRETAPLLGHAGGEAVVLVREGGPIASGSRSRRRWSRLTCVRQGH